MARINLLPWRAERRAARQKEFYAMLGFAAIGGVVLSALIYLFYGQQIGGEQERIDFLKGEISKVESQIKEIDDLDKKKARLLAREKVIEELQANRSQMVHLFDSLVRTIPDGVALTNIKQVGNQMTLEGRAQSNARVSTYMRNLETAGWMAKPELSIIEAKRENSRQSPLSGASRVLPYAFSLKVDLANPNSKDANGDGVPDSEADGATDAASPPAAETSSPASSAAPAAAPVAAPPATSAPATQTRPAS
jgi:type IV pilus assembly protein PilN